MGLKFTRKLCFWVNFVLPKLYLCIPDHFQYSKSHVPWIFRCHRIVQNTLFPLISILASVRAWIVVWCRRKFKTKMEIENVDFLNVDAHWHHTMKFWKLRKFWKQNIEFRYLWIFFIFDNYVIFFLNIDEWLCSEIIWIHRYFFRCEYICFFS